MGVISLIQIETMTDRNVSFVMKLKEEAGWNQTDLDIRRFLSLALKGCFIAKWGNDPVGTATTCVFDRVGWIGMLLVSKRHRGQGIGSVLFEHAMAHLTECGATSMRLDATELGRPLYEKRGFRSQFQLSRYAGRSSKPSRDAENVHAMVQPATAETLGELADVDSLGIGYDRKILLSKLLQDPAVSAWKSIGSGNQAGYVVIRPGSLAWQIGPCIAGDGIVGGALLDTAFSQQTGPFFIDVPDHNTAAVGYCERVGLRVARTFTRMCHGTLVQENTDLLWASGGPEKG